MSVTRRNRPAISDAMWRLQGFDRTSFIRNHWQKSPCLLRGAFAEFESPLDPVAG